MRLSARTSEEFPLLGGLIETLATIVENDPGLRTALIASATDRQEALEHGLQHPTNPWVSVADAGDLPGSDDRGGYSQERKSTVILARAFVERLNEGGTEATTAVTTALLRGVLHFVARQDWVSPDSAPGRAFEAALGLAPTVSPPPHDAPGSIDIAVDEPVSSENKPVAYMLGAAILDIARRHLGQPYDFTPTPDYDDPDWRGAFDCAEFASYCAFRAYRIPYGVVKDPTKRYNSYSGYWRRDAETLGIRIPWRDSLHIPGAFLLRYPPRTSPPPYGHVAISLGDGSRTYEARGKRYGVVQHVATNRSWDCGVLLPGVLYDMPEGIGSDLLIFKAFDPPGGHSPIVELIQKRLVELGNLAESQVNGIYDGTTEAAVTAFQTTTGLTIDGEVGPATGAELGLGNIWDDAPVRGHPGLAADLPTDAGAMDSEVLTLARTLYGEARGESRRGQEAVANVIMNRVRSPRYPNTVAKVCLQRWQFSCWNENDPNRSTIEGLQPGANAVFDLLIDVARLAIFGGLPVHVVDALHYHTKNVRPSWVTNSPAAELVIRIGAHLFWRGIR